MNIAIINAGGANFLSVVVALEKHGVTAIVTHDKDEIAKADAIILPGVGAAEFSMQKLSEYDLIELIRNYKKPLLGICLGMQLLYDYSAEGNVACLGIIKGEIKKFNDLDVTVPHMGWNNLEITKANSIASGIDKSDDVYFVHSFYAPFTLNTIATCNYGHKFSAIVNSDNFYGMQFHPEKSGAIGEKLLKNFINIVKLSIL